ncbi:MAG: hypothetical protein QNJ05_03670 [Woeseiaceae bacterium]|nr:hypothetical protein [Woeseiaceae bacterium]
MNEVVVDSSAVPGSVAKPRRERKSNAFYGYSITILALGVGWLLRDRDWITAEAGLGYWLGIVGGSMMLLLLLYPLRKRYRALKFLGAIPGWFRTHMVLGVIAPVLVLYHSNFQLGSFNSRFALFCMLLVAASGVIGRYIYAGIHRGLYGEKTSLRALQKELADSVEQSHGLAVLMPELTQRLEAVSADIQGCALRGSLSVRGSLVWTLRSYATWLQLRRTARRELKARAAESHTIAADLAKLRRTSYRYIGRYIRLVRRIAQFTLFERLFALWHILHLPLFYMMVISALVHVLAVHMY